MGLVGFTPTMACSIAMVYFTMAAWLLKLFRERPLGADIGIYIVDPAGIAIGRLRLHGVAILILAVGGVR